MSIQYKAPGFEPTTFQTWPLDQGSKHQELRFLKTFSKLDIPGTDPIKILQPKFYATQFFKHSDWILNIFNQSKCLKK